MIIYSKLEAWCPNLCKGRIQLGSPGQGGRADWGLGWPAGGALGSWQAGPTLWLNSWSRGQLTFY